MPWDEKNVRVFEAQKSAPKLTTFAFRSGVYKRAIALLESENSNGTERSDTAKSLYRVLANAQRRATRSKEQSSDQLASKSRQQHQRSSKEQSKQDKRQRHEQGRRDQRQRHQQRLQLRQEVAAQRKLQAEERDQQLQQLHDKQKLLELQLKQHRQKHAEQAAVSQTTEQPDAMPDLQQSLQKVQQQKVKAEQQLAMVMQLHFACKKPASKVWLNHAF